MPDSLDTSSVVSEPTVTVTPINPTEPVLVPVTNGDNSSPVGTLTNADHIKNIRDTVIAGLAVTLPNVLQQLRSLILAKVRSLCR